jgi:hypothetical protein
MGNVNRVFRIDGAYFQYKTLEQWTKKARFIAFDYHAFILYVALLFDSQPVALDAIRCCQETADGGLGK